MRQRKRFTRRHRERMQKQYGANTQTVADGRSGQHAQQVV
jgi:hypothetical protein